ncbi:hypothetical protein M0812_12814 [Anaeramoeba flamelloides]|uniref:FHA domain-containing protein n=1 Tax=Anaeramoeba flamelloides TaxID=1746091 RepID=A0AAV7ZRI0_9EUKA|nr:hypothetical protein M0812_12814 [Anaeramoeba flamelloides]
MSIFRRRKPKKKTAKTDNTKQSNVKVYLVFSRSIKIKPPTKQRKGFKILSEEEEKKNVICLNFSQLGDTRVVIGRNPNSLFKGKTKTVTISFPKSKEILFLLDTDMTVSRRHCIVTCKSQGVYIENVSKSACMISGKIQEFVQVNKPKKLLHNDLVMIGKEEYCLSLSSWAYFRVGIGEKPDAKDKNSKKSENSENDETRNSKNENNKILNTKPILFQSPKREILDILQSYNHKTENTQIMHSYLDNLNSDNENENENNNSNENVKEKDKDNINDHTKKEEVKIQGIDNSLLLLNKEKELEKDLNYENQNEKEIDKILENMNENQTDEKNDQNFKNQNDNDITFETDSFSSLITGQRSSVLELLIEEEKKRNEEKFQNNNSNLNNSENL